MDEIQLADVDSTQLPKKEILRRPVLRASIRIKNANYWEKYGGSI